jgi:tetratricopeptide (TPR) repeat protein
MTRTDNERPEVAPTPDAARGLAVSVNDAEVIEALQEYRAAQQTGRGADRQQLLSRFPHLAGELSACLEALDFVAAAAPGLHSDRLSGESTLEQECPREALGDFRLLREVGRGGMGVVYEAMQLSLGRRVALKVLPLAAALDSRQLQRFKNEAQAAAHLQHQHIVPVYAVGCERGVHYYAMQFIDGRTLAEMIHELRLSAAPQAEPTGPYTPGEDSGGGARPAETATAGIAALSTERAGPGPAHLRTVAQWGVQAALALEHAHGLGVIHRDIKPANLMVDGRGNLWITDFGLAHCQSQAGLTMSGDLIGTLRYMSPEQALAQRVVIDHRTDIYSLGATLYELLTLEPAFGGSDRQELLRQIAFEEPRSLRLLNRLIPAELETIVLKALEKNPAERYSTAQELADDLERWLKDEPIRARRPSVLQRLRRWGRRHWTLVGAAVVCLLLAGASLAGSVGWVLRDEAMRWAQTEQTVIAATTEARALLARGQLPEALATARGAHQTLANAGGSKELRQRVADLLADLKMVARLEEISLRQFNVGQIDLAQMDVEYATAFRDFGIDVEALEPEEAAARIQTRSIPVALAAALDAWVRLRKEIRKGDDRSWKRLVVVARLADPDRRRNQLRDVLERRDWKTLRKLASEPTTGWPVPTRGLLCSGLVQIGAAEQEVAQLQKVRQEHPSDFWVNYHLARAHMQQKPPQWEQAIRYLTAAVAIRSQSPGTYLNLGVALMEKGERDEAIAAFQKAIGLQKDFHEAHNNLGNVLTESGRLDEAIAAYREAIRLRKDHAVPHYNLGTALVAQDRLDEAIAAFREAIRLDSNYANAHNNLGNALRTRGRLDEAIASFEKAIRIDRDHRTAHCNLGLALYDSGRLDEAIAAYRIAIRLNKSNAEAHNHLGVALASQDRLDEAILVFQQATRLDRNNPRPPYNLGNALSARGRLDEAIAAYQEAIHRKKDHTAAYCNLGIALCDMGRLDEAIAAYQEAIRIDRDDPLSHYNLGNALKASDRLDEAIAAYRQAIWLRKDYALAHCNLGFVLMRQGDFPQAVAELRLGNQFGSTNPRWSSQPVLWLRQAERLLELNAKLPNVLNGQVRPASALERVELAWLCQQSYRQLHAAAARLYAQAFAVEPKLAGDLRAAHRYNAACAAALAGCGQGTDPGQLDDQERTRLRQQALSWLRADLAAWRKQLEGSPASFRPIVRQAMQHWLADRDFASVRGPAALDRLPRSERQHWETLWAEVEELFAHTDGMSPRPEK